MLKTSRPAIVLAMLALAVLACAGGSITNQSQRCSDRQCEGSVDRLTGSTALDITNYSIRDGDSIPVTVELTSGAGRVEVSLTAPDGTEASGVAGPGAPVTVTGVATGILIMVDSTSLDEEGLPESNEIGGFQIVLTALDESAEDVTYRLSYSLP